jgi:hypothetical protein
MKQKQFSKKAAFLMAIVIFVFAMFMTVNVKAVAPGGVYCSDLANCSGSAGCPDYGSVTGCVIDCSGGGSVWCDWANPE